MEELIIFFVKTICFIVAAGYFFPKMKQNRLLGMAGGAFALYAGYLVIVEISGHFAQSTTESKNPQEPNPKYGIIARSDNKRELITSPRSSSVPSWTKHDVISVPSGANTNEALLNFDLNREAGLPHSVPSWTRNNAHYRSIDDIPWGR
jgi:hypothetical protein